MHRDLKPDNIMFHNDIVKISDFGFARMIEGDPNQAYNFTLKGYWFTLCLEHRCTYRPKSSMAKNTHPNLISGLLEQSCSSWCSKAITSLKSGLLIN
jgi:serine/threonine protein kinase